MYKWLTSFVVIFAGISLAGWASQAGGDKRGGEKRIVSANSSSTQQLRAAEAGAVSGPLSALNQAAERGDLDAQLKLAGIYAAGKPAPASQLKAFNLLQRIVDTHGEMHPRDARARRVAGAFVALGDYFRTGISGTALKMDKRRAAALYWHAASYLGDAEAQVNLAQMHLLGEGVPRNGPLAVKWLANAAKKRHARAQAILGDLLWRGAQDVRRRPRKGLALLTIAVQNARDEEEAAWIETLRVSALAHSQTHERTGAARLAAIWQTSIGRPEAVVSAPVVPAVESDLPVSDAPLQGSRTDGISNISLDAAAPR